MNVYSIFESINGETSISHQGSVCTFLRLWGCNLDCTWCDTKYARSDPSDNSLPKRYEERSVEDVFFDLIRRRNKNITTTGGEPLMQYNTVWLLLVALLAKSGIQVTVETNGTFYPFVGFDESRRQKKLSYVVDYKLPSSGMEDRMDWNIFRELRDTDFVKFVILTEKDYESAKEMLKEFESLKSRYSIPKIIFSPAFLPEESGIGINYKGEKGFTFLRPETLIQLAVEDHLNVIVSLQLHKLCSWGEAK